MSDNQSHSGGIKWTSRREAQLPSINEDLSPESEESQQGLRVYLPVIPEHVKPRTRISELDGQKATCNNDAMEESAIAKNLRKAIQLGNKARLLVLLRRCGPLSVCTGVVNKEGPVCDQQRHDICCDISNAVIEELLNCTVDSSDTVDAVIESGFDLHDAHECINGRRLWFWAALKDHVNLVAYMLAAGFPADQGIAMSDRSILTSALPADSDTLPQGITALFAALIANAYNVASYLIKHEATLKLHFHEHKDLYTVPEHNEEREGRYDPVVVDAMMVLAPRFPRPHPSPYNDVYLDVVACLLSRGLDPTLPSNLWIKASSIFFKSLSQGHPSHEYVQEIPFVLKVALYGHVEIMKLLVERGVDIETRGFRGLALLHFAIRSTNLDMVEYVVDLAEDINHQDDFGYGALHHAIALDLPEITQCLLEYDADVDLPSKNGLTPLHLAVSLKNVEMCDVLLEHGANVNTSLANSVTSRSFSHIIDWYDLTSTEMVFGSTPLISALCPDKMVYVYTMSRDSDSDATDTDSASDVKDSLTKSGDMFDDDSEESLFAGTTERGNARVSTTQTYGVRHCLVELLLQHGAKACQMGYFFKKRLDLRKKHGAHDWESSPFAFEIEWCYPLALAAKMTTEAWSVFTQTSLRNVRGTAEVVHMIMNEAKSELTPYMLNEVLSAACFTNLKNYGRGRGTGRSRLSRPVIEMLLDRGVDVNQRNNQGFTLLHLACIPWSNDDEQCKIIDRVLELGAYVETRCPEGKTPLHWAAAWSFNALEILLGHGADTFVHDDSKRDPLHYACSNPNSLHDNRGIRLLLQHRYHRESMSGDETRLALACDNEWSQKECEILHCLIDPESPQHTNSALLMACKKDRMASITTICQYSRPWQVYSLRDQYGGTPLIEAVKSGSSEVVSNILHGIAIAYRESLDASAVMPDDFDCEATDRQPVHFHRGAKRLEPHQDRYSIAKQSNTSSNGPRTTDFPEPQNPGADKSFLVSPPQIGGLLHSEQYIRKGRLLHGDMYSGMAGVAPLDAVLRAACLNAQDHSGWTALHHAVAGGNVDIVRLLLEEPEVALEPSSTLSRTPLDLARASGKMTLIDICQKATDIRNASSKGKTSLRLEGGAVHSGKSKVLARALATNTVIRGQYTQLGRVLNVQLIQVFLVVLVLLWSLWDLSGALEGVGPAS